MCEVAGLGVVAMALPWLGRRGHALLLGEEGGSSAIHPVLDGGDYTSRYPFAGLITTIDRKKGG
jgi:hypothetical protein